MPVTKAPDAEFIKLKSLLSNAPDPTRTGLANQLAKGGAITANAAADLAQGTVSLQDLSTAKELAERLKGTPLGDVAATLKQEVDAAAGKQSVFSTVKASLGDVERVMLNAQQKALGTLR